MTKPPSLFDNPFAPADGGADHAHNAPIFSVSEISQGVKRLVEGAFDHVRIRGEISGAKLHSSGHFYCSLKDESSVLQSVCWRGNVSRLSIRPEEGMEVICTGRLTTYPGRSQYQLVIESMELAGVGALLKLLEERKKKLAAEGLFDPSRKKPLPVLPKVIGVITSPTGAVIRDILHRLEERLPCHVLLWPVAVQGENAAEQIAAAIDGFNKNQGQNFPRPDLLIVARGGGSIEDLWPFNEEIVVRAAAASQIPLISAVGHETDTTLIDYVADLRAPTPTGAAEKAVPERLALLSYLGELEQRLKRRLQGYYQDQKKIFAILAKNFEGRPKILDMKVQSLDDKTERFAQSRLLFFSRLQNRFHKIYLTPLRLQNLCQNFRGRLDFIAKSFEKIWRYDQKRAWDQLKNLGALLQSFSYERVLERGFALVLDEKGQHISTAAAASKENDLRLRFQDGEIEALAKKPKT